MTRATSIPRAAASTITERRASLTAAESQAQRYRFPPPKVRVRKDVHDLNAAEWIVYDAMYAYCREMVRRDKPEGAFR